MLSLKKFPVGQNYEELQQYIKSLDDSQLYQSQQQIIQFIRPIFKNIKQLTHAYHQQQLFDTMTLINQKLVNFNNSSLKCHKLLNLVKAYEQQIGRKLKANDEGLEETIGNLRRKENSWVQNALEEKHQSLAKRRYPCLDINQQI